MTVQARVRAAVGQFTASERKIANAILADYPFVALDGIQDLAERTGVSAPSITRFVAKIGCAGFQDFQRQLIAELKEGRRSPLDLQTRQTPVGDRNFLADYAGRLSERLAEMGAMISEDQFDAICRLIADPGRAVYVLGGRVSNTLATFLSIHLRQIRGNVHQLPENPELWPDLVMSMRRKDVVVLFDFRRYQRSLQDLAELIAAKRRPTIVAVTDKWISPIARHSQHIVALPIDAGTAWDTMAATLAFVEATIVKVSEADWAATQARIRSWDALRLGGPTSDREPAADLENDA